MPKLTFAVVGCGQIGSRHLEVIKKEPNAELVALCDIDTEKLRNLKKEYNDVSLFEHYEKMLSETDVDVVSICTPHRLHSEMSIKAAEHGIHILVEKPMALTSEKSQEMIDVAKKNNVRLFVVKQNRYNKPIALTKKALSEKKLGNIYMVQCNVMWNRYKGYYSNSSWRGRKELEGGALHTQVSHFIDLLVWWFGDLEKAKTIMDTLHQDVEIEDCGVSALRFKSGVIGSLLWTTAVYNVNYEGSITIIGEKGTIKIGGKYLNKIEFWDVKSYPMPKEMEFDDLPNLYSNYQGTSSNHDLLFSDLISKIVKGRKGMVEGPEGMRTVEAIEMIYQNTE